MMKGDKMKCPMMGAKKQAMGMRQNTGPFASLFDASGYGVDR